MPEVTIRDILQHFLEIDEDCPFFDHAVTQTVKMLGALVEPTEEIIAER